MKPSTTQYTFQHVFRATPVPALLVRPNSPVFTIVDVNQNYLKTTRRREKDLIGRGLFEAFPDNPNDPEADGTQNLQRSLDIVIETGEPHTMETQRYDIPIRDTDQFEESYWKPTNFPVFNDSGDLIFILHTVERADSLEKIRSHHLYQLEQLERSVLEQFEKQKGSIQELLTMYMSGIQSLHPGMLCSVMRVEPDALYFWSAPSLPDEYIRSIDGLAPGPGQGPCGAAAWESDPVIASDILADPRWKKFHTVAQRFNLQACWSYPLLSADGEAMATLAMYFHSPRSPGELEKLTIRRSVYLLQIILDNHQKEEALRKSNERYSYISKATNEAIYDWDFRTGHLHFSDLFFRDFDYPEDPDRQTIDGWKQLVHPEDRKRMVQSLDNVLEDSEQHIWKSDYRLKKRNGFYAHIEEQGYILRNDNGTPVRMIGTLRDVTERKELQILLAKSNKMARIGSWEIDLVNQRLYLSEITREIYELGPDVEPDLDQAIFYYKEGPDRDAIDRAVRQGIKYGKPWDLELRIVTDKGRLRWVRVIGEAEQVEGRTIRLYGSFQDITDRKREQQQIADSLQEKEILLAEIHHRVKNNLAIVSALIQLQASTMEEVPLAETLMSSVSRIKTMANIHEFLYRSENFSNLEFSEGLKQLIGEIIETFPTARNIDVDYDCVPVQLSMNQAIPCSLIVNEVITNVIKHAYPLHPGSNTRNGSNRLWVRLQIEGTKVVLEIEDNGVGLPEPVDPESEESLGIRLISQLTEQIQGRCSFSSRNGGTKFALEFNKSESDSGRIRYYA